MHFYSRYVKGIQHVKLDENPCVGAYETPFQLHNQFQRFLNQTSCVFSQMKDIKHIRRDFYPVAWVMPQKWDFGVMWVKN